MPTREDLIKKRKPIKNVNQVHQESFTRIERLAVWITDHVGTMRFFFLVFAWTIIWLAWNILGPASLRFDPFPAFVLWLFISNMMQLLFLPLIMVGQNLEERHAELRAENDFEVDQKAEMEIEVILDSLERQEKTLEEIKEKLGKSVK